MSALKKATDQTVKAVQELRACQDEFCKKQLAASDKLANSIKSKTSALIGRMAKKEITHDQFTVELGKVREKVLADAATQNLGACMIDKCQDKLKATFQRTLEVHKSMCKQQKIGCSIYKQGMALLNKKTFDVDAYVEMLKALAQK
jgi:hypothetical protein